MKVTKCDICGTVVDKFDGASITINPQNLRQKFVFKNGERDIAVPISSFDLCRDCLCKSLRKYYGENLK